MSRMTSCLRCGAMISNEARTCRRCGAIFNRTAVVPIGLAIMLAIAASYVLLQRWL
jgi:RNA polymerase subunit RPABC4/transcription elongation factor Spt4